MKLFVFKYCWSAQKFNKIILAINKERAVEMLKADKQFTIGNISEININKEQTIHIN